MKEREDTAACGRFQSSSKKNEEIPPPKVRGSFETSDLRSISLPILSSSDTDTDPRYPGYMMDSTIALEKDFRDNQVLRRKSIERVLSGSVVGLEEKRRAAQLPTTSTFYNRAEFRKEQDIQVYCFSSLVSLSFFLP